MSNPYSISLLNDLHHHFPDLLYRPTRFRNVGDVLNYIISVAQHNPYDEEREAYEQRVARPSATSVAAATSAAATTIPIVIPSSRSSINQLLHNNYVSPLQSDAMLQSDIMLGTSRSQHNRRSIFQSPPVDPIMSFIGQLIGSSSVGIGTSSVGIRDPSSVGIGSTGASYGLDVLQAFLNDRVPVVPSPEQLEAGTILTHSLQTQDDNCSICQDPIEQNQQMRIIRHCTHRFHRTCIDTWFQQNVSCPTCRHDIRE